MKKPISIILLLSLLLSLVGCAWTDGKKPNVRSRVISYAHFNTASQIFAYGDMTDDTFESYVKLADETLEYYHKLFDIYYEYSGVNNVKTINKNAGKAPVTVDRELLDFLSYCKELYTFTDGKTNVMLGSVLKIWHDAREEAEGNFGSLPESRLPSADELREAAEHTSIDSLMIDRKAQTVYISDPRASLDVGAIAKGYTVDILYNKLKAAGADSIVLNIGGNIRTIGVKPDGSNWISGITNPDKTAEDSLKCRIIIGECSVVTSGDYERYFYAGDKKYNHIIDPETMMPAEYFASVSIIADESGLADALSTALFCMPYESGVALLEKIGGVNAVWILKDGTIKSTDGVTLAE